MRPHGIMFHHFCAPGSRAGQGAITASQLDDMIRFVGRDRILPADEWARRAATDSLEARDLCLTFDDNLRCQYDVALPVLREHELTAFWFVYTSVLDGALERMELYRQFRTMHFGDIDAFYDRFFDALRGSTHGRRADRALAGFEVRAYLSDFSFYTDRDREFRFVRDEVLGVAGYDELMDALMRTMGVEMRGLAEGLWMDEECLRGLASAGHVLGLHSHTHPMRLGELPHEDQRAEYRENLDRLSQHCGSQPASMAHPCNSYGAETLAILRELGVKLGFRSNMVDVRASELEYPRQDHTTLLEAMRRE